VHPLMMGLEEHLLTMFRDDFEFRDAAGASHLGHAAAPATPPPPPKAAVDTLSWAPDAEREMSAIPFFVRGKARRNTERFARERGLETITVDTLYDAKAHFGR
jgi:light-independent protochlorophyllide reductase subunit B